LLLMAVLPESGYKAASAVPFGAVALLLSLVFGLMSWRDRFGKIAAIGAGVLTLGGLVVSLVSYADYERTKLQEMEQARRQAEDVNRAVSAEFRVTVYVFEAPADFEERDLRPGDLEDANAVQMTNPTNVVVRSGGEGRIKVPELPLVDESGSGGSGYKKNTLYVKPTLMAAGTRVRLVLERDVPATGARDFIFANSLELGALTIIQSKSVGARKQMAVMKVEMLGSARLRTESPVVRQFGNEPLHLPWKATLLLLGFLYLVYRVWRRYGWWAAFLLVLAALTVVLMMTRSQDVKISPSSPKQVTIRPDEPVQVEAEAKDGSEKSDSKTSTATEKPEAKNAHLVKGLIVTGVLKEIIGNFPTYGPVRVGDAFEIDLSNLPKNKIELSRPHFDAKAHAPPYIPFSTPLLIEQVKEPWGNAKSGFVSGSIRLSSIDASSRLIIQVGTKEFKKGEKVSMSLLQEIYGLINCMATAEGVFK
ncbi:MAG: hypothetical protein K8R87_04475, partial [Verrucomicrobia bacterium]|nr:hypothetical protein [Verrucomicrobiota bacterium]